MEVAMAVCTAAIMRVWQSRWQCTTVMHNEDMAVAMSVYRRHDEGMAVAMAVYRRHNEGLSSRWQ